jgi:predicted RNA-binding protein with PUA-like domain
MGRWVFLADPGSFGWGDLVEEGGAVWDGISNRAAQGRLREAKRGDGVLLYHTSPDKALVGVARVASDPYPDPSHAERVVVDLEPVTALARPLALAEIRGDELLSEAGFVRMPRVAIHEAPEAVWDRVLELTGTDPGSAVDMDPAGAGGP